MDDTEKMIRERLFSYADNDYREFVSRLTPSIDPKTVIGVRTPEIRRLAAELSKMPPDVSGEPVFAGFFKMLPHTYYEENNLHGFLIGQLRDFDACVAELERFLPYIDNWATCDMLRPKVFSKRPPSLPAKIREWIASGKTYTIRFGIETLMCHYLKDECIDEYLELIAGLRSDEYYVNMMTAWFFATALAENYEQALPYIVNRRLDAGTHNKTIRKAIESLRITAARKSYLRAQMIRGTC